MASINITINAVDAVGATASTVVSVSNDAGAGITHGSQLTAGMTGYGSLGVTQAQLQVMSVPSRGYWRGDTPSEFSLSTAYVNNNTSTNKGGVVPAGGMVIDGYTVPAGTIVVQFRDFSAGDFYMSGNQNYLYRGCRFRGNSNFIGYWNCATSHTGFLRIHYCDLGGLSAAAASYHQVPIDIKAASGLIVYRNRIQFTTTGIQANISNQIEIAENFISDLTTFGTEDHLNGIMFNGGENNAKVLRNNVVIRNPDGAGRSVGQTDCIGFFQDFGDFTGATQKVIDSNFVGGTGYCIYAGMNPGKPATSVKNMVVTNNLITTQYYPTGGAFGPIAAEPPWGTNGNTKSNNKWADGPNAGNAAF